MELLRSPQDEVADTQLFSNPKYMEDLQGQAGKCWG